MDNDPVFQYLKLFLENLSIWPILFVLGIMWFIRNPDALEALPRFFTKLKLGPLEAEFRQLRQELEETKQQVGELEADINDYERQLQSLAETFDPNAPVAELASTREALKALAGNIEDPAVIRRGLSSDVNAAELYAAAEIARAKRDVTLFEDVVACLDRLGSDAKLSGVRLHTVWTLTSALHRTLIADHKHGVKRLTTEQLERARAVLAKLVANPRVLSDRVDAPMKGVRGPAKWANDWIEKALKDR